MSPAISEVEAEEDLDRVERVLQLRPESRFGIELTVKEFRPPFKPNVTRYRVEVVAVEEIDAIKLASGKVPTKGYPYDSVSVRVLWSKPLFDEAQLQEIFRATDHLKSIEEMKAEAA